MSRPAEGLPPVQRPPTARPRADSAGLDAAPVPPTHEELLAIESQLVELASLAGAAVEDDRELGACLVRWPGRGPALNHAELVRWPADPGELARRIDRLRSRLHAGGDRPAVLVAPALTEPGGLAGLLEGLGWRRMLRERILWTRRAAVVPHLDPLLRVEAVTPATAPAYESLERSIFDIDPLLAEPRLDSLRGALVSGRLRAYLVRAADEPLATARLWSFGTMACLDGVGVVPQARRQGYGTLVTTIATRAALATGHRLVWLEVAGDNTGAAVMYEGLDYRPAFDWDLWVGD